MVGPSAWTYPSAERTNCSYTWLPTSEAGPPNSTVITGASPPSPSTVPSPGVPSLMSGAILKADQHAKGGSIHAG
jgi:hypothetical protein